MTENKIRPGIRAKVYDILDGVVGEPDGNGTFLFVGDNGMLHFILRAIPLPFRPGDRVDVKTRDDGVKRATVIKLDHIANEGYTPVHVDDTDEVDGFYAEAVTLIDYPGKEAE